MKKNAIDVVVMKSGAKLICHEKKCYWSYGSEFR